MTPPNGPTIPPATTTGIVSSPDLTTANPPTTIDNTPSSTHLPTVVERTSDSPLETDSNSNSGGNQETDSSISESTTVGTIVVPPPQNFNTNTDISLTDIASKYSCLTSIPIPRSISISILYSLSVLFLLLSLPFSLPFSFSIYIVSLYSTSAH